MSQKCLRGEEKVLFLRLSLLVIHSCKNRSNYSANDRGLVVGRGGVGGGRVARWFYRRTVASAASTDARQPFPPRDEGNFSRPRRGIAALFPFARQTFLRVFLFRPLSTRRRVTMTITPTIVRPRRRQRTGRERMEIKQLKFRDKETRRG